MNYNKIYYEVKLNDPNTMMMQTKKKTNKKTTSEMFLLYKSVH